MRNSNGTNPDKEAWWVSAAQGVPRVSTELPGPESRHVHERTTRHFRGLSSQVKLFPVAFEEGYGVVLKDVDGNEFLDFSSGIYVTSLGHAHPKISEAVAYWAKRLMNAHDFSTRVKAQALEQLVGVLPQGFEGVQMYSDGTSAVEAAIRAGRAATGKHEFISCYRDFHGKTLGAVSCAQMHRGDVFSYGPTRAPGFYMVPRPDPYRPLFSRTDGTIDTDAYIDLYSQFLTEGTVGNVCGFVLEPVQGWAGSVFPPEDFFPKLRRFCDERGLLLIDDEVLAGMGRTGEWLALDHYGVAADIVVLGKSFGNGFPVSAIAVKGDHAEALDKISASSSYGGNPMACAAILASLQVIKEERILENVRAVGRYFTRRMEQIKASHSIVGDVRNKGFLLGMELVKDRATKEPFPEAGSLVYQKAFAKGLAWIPAGHILRMSPPLIMDEERASLGMDIIEEAIFEVERELGHS